MAGGKCNTYVVVRTPSHVLPDITYRFDGYMYLPHDKEYYLVFDYSWTVLLINNIVPRGHNPQDFWKKSQSQQLLPLYPCSQTIIELECLHTIKPEPGLSSSSFLFFPQCWVFGHCWAKTHGLWRRDLLINPYRNIIRYLYFLFENRELPFSIYTAWDQYMKPHNVWFQKIPNRNPWKVTGNSNGVGVSKAKNFNGKYEA